MNDLGETKKDELLKRKKYTYNHESLCYVNHDHGKIFTRAYIQDNSLETIEKNINESFETTSWQIYRNKNQADSVLNILSIHGDKPIPQ